MTQTIREQLQALVKDIKFICDMNVMLDRRRILMELESILATPEPAVTGWRPIAEYDAMGRKPSNVIFWAVATQSGRSMLPARVFTERLCGFRTVTHFVVVDAPNGGPECVMEATPQ